MSRKLPQLWAKKGGIQVSDVGFGFYVVNFETIADYERAMFGGPWMVNDHYVVIQEWRPYFRPEETLLSTLRVWVRLPGIPFEYFDREILKIIGDRIGRTVRIDHTTLEGSRGNFARICVEVDLSKPLLSKYRLRRRVRRIEYEGLHTICFNCGCYGHKDDVCKQEPEVVVMENQTTSFANPIFQEALESDSRPEVDEDFGPWMHVKKNRRKVKPSVTQAKVSPLASSPASNSGKGNSFAVLGNQDSSEDIGKQKSRGDSHPLININEEPLGEDLPEGEKENIAPEVNAVSPGQPLISDGPVSAVSGSVPNPQLGMNRSHPLESPAMVADSVGRNSPLAGPGESLKFSTGFNGGISAQSPVEAPASSSASSLHSLQKQGLFVKGVNLAKPKAKESTGLKGLRSKEASKASKFKNGPTAMEEL
ncbi:hypothetical protein LINPERHAP2_LOCUS5742 [Linum perenne]